MTDETTLTERRRERKAALAGGKAAPQGRILVCDDDDSLLLLIRDILEGEGHEVETTASARQALARLESAPWDILLADLVMPDLGGLELLDRARRLAPATEVIIITGHGDIDSAVSAIKQGATDYLTKPFHPEKLALDIRKVLERRRLAEDLEAFRRREEGRESLGGLLGRSPAMQALFRLIERVGPTRSSVLILGESGTGKELAARELHALSPLRDGPFVTVSCGSIPETLLESELFGHVKGAFTGASAHREGLFESAEGGTILLDEVGTTSAQAQVGLLRVLQEREVRRIGGTASKKIDVRVIAATNTDLERAIDEGRFRGDLFYRLSAVTLRLPPLRERPEDIGLLAEHFLSIHARRSGRPARRISPRAMEALCRYAWPGNVRELEHVVEHAVVFCEGEMIRPRDLPAGVRQEEAAEPGAGMLSLEQLESRHIAQVLRKTNGNKLKAARILGIPRASLYRRIRKYRLEAAAARRPAAATKSDRG